MKIRFPLLGVFIVLLGLSVPGVAFATDETDLRVSLKVIPLLNPKITGTAAVAIVFDPANPGSKADAETIRSIIDGGLKAPGGVQLISLLVPVGDLEKLSSARLAFLTGGISSAGMDAVSAAAARAGVLTMSTTLDYVKSNRCVLGIVARPSVQIYYSESAAEAGKIKFSQAFTMLVTHI